MPPREARFLLDGKWDEVAAIDEALDRGEIDEAGWYRRSQALIVPGYLAASDPRAQSGHSGDADRWREARGQLVEAIDRDGTLLDVGCANGHLMETAVEWALERGRRIEPYGLDLSPALLALARERLPAWRDRFFAGNALDWRPPFRFDLVHLQQLEYVPPARRPELIAHLLGHVCRPGGRLIVGSANELRDGPCAASLVESAGFPIAGRTERDHPDARAVRRVFWLDAPADSVLFLCTGNYFRSRYAEVLFNHRAREAGLSCRATSRGLAVERGSKNVGPMTRVAIERLARRGIATPDLERAPAQVTSGELAAAARIVALKEVEHRPLVSARYPAFAGRIEYGHVDDVDCCPAEEALDAIDALVDELLGRFDRS